ncbi:unnamed protein product [Clonostachys rosea f. rosea IK726]|uniref:Uncharacterized protein n=2 Tax=Bionectria ochroleuca TaxID=29856 RepID=A0A0B7K431_BIOOC|nr:unnamed protein product [Clonostachys rosea f. rosea IK726]
MALDVKLIRKLFLVTTDRFDYASRVVSQSLQSSPAAWFWYGKTTWLVRFLDAFFCRTIWVGLSTLENVRFWEVEENARSSSSHATK